MLFYMFFEYPPNMLCNLTSRISKKKYKYSASINYLCFIHIFEIPDQ